jgi:hypothetical protein
MRRIEWIGHKSVYADPRYQLAKIEGRLTPAMRAAYRASIIKRVYRVPGRTARELGPKDPGLSRTYRWGPQKDSYVQDVEDGDWRMIQESDARIEFRDVTDGIPDPILTPNREIVSVKEEAFSDFRKFVREMGSV